MILQAPRSSEAGPSQPLTVQDFLNLPDDGNTYELVDGKAIPKLSPKEFHARLTRVLLMLLMDWAGDRGEVFPELAVVLGRQGKAWVPVPDLLYLSRGRFPEDWQADGACTVPPDLVIEIISPGQSFGEMAQKAEDYLGAGVQRVWVIDSKARSVTVFYPDAPPQTFTGESALSDAVLPGLSILPEAVFQRACI